MTRLDYPTFEKIAFYNCAGIIEDEKTGDIKSLTMPYLDRYVLLASGMDGPEQDRLLNGNTKGNIISDDSLSRFRSGKKPLSGWIIGAYAGKNRNVLEEIICRHFEKELDVFLNENNIVNLKKQLFDAMINDKLLPVDELNYLKESYCSDNNYLFIAKCFIIAILRSTFTDAEEYRPNELISIVLDDFKNSKSSKFIDGLIKELSDYINSDFFDILQYSHEDVKYFCEHMVPYINLLTPIQKFYFFQIREAAIKWEINDETMKNVLGVCNAAFSKYGVGNKQFHLLEVGDIDNNSITLQLKHYRTTYPFNIIEELEVKTPEEMSRIIGVPIDDWPNHGFTYDMIKSEIDSYWSDAKVNKRLRDKMINRLTKLRGI